MIYDRNGFTRATRVPVEQINLEVRKCADEFEIVIDGWPIKTVFREELSQQALAILESLAAQEAL